MTFPVRRKLIMPLCTISGNLSSHLLIVKLNASLNVWQIILTCVKLSSKGWVYNVSLLYVCYVYTQDWKKENLFVKVNVHYLGEDVRI
jgi:hypothetical protein